MISFILHPLKVNAFYKHSNVSLFTKTVNLFPLSKKLLDSAYADGPKALEQLNSTLLGLSAEEVEARLEKYGTNEVAKEKHQAWYMRLWDNVKNPLVILLTLLGGISFLTGDLRATIMILAMVLLGIILRYFQESRADKAAEELQAMVSTTTTVIREGTHQEIALRELVPGDVATLSAGDMVPADVRVLSCKDLLATRPCFIPVGLSRACLPRP
jgi:Mg2+-importing ATPase